MMFYSKYKISWIGNYMGHTTKQTGDNMEEASDDVINHLTEAPRVPVGL
jgi:hypothetical protein